MKYGVTKNTLLITAGIVWLLAGINILRIGISCWINDSHYWFLKLMVFPNNRRDVRKWFFFFSAFFSYSFSPVFAESALLRALWFVFRNLSGFSSGLLLFRLSLFSVCCFRIGSFLFPSLYARANIIMCVSFSSRVLRYKNMLCNTSVIQSITKKFQEIRIIFPSYVCW